MTGREWGALIILAGLALLAVAFAAGIRALILAATHQGRHEQREAEADAEAETFVAELRGLPKPGLDYISDQDVRLPWTPPLMSNLDEPPIVADITDAARRAILAPAGQCSDPPEESCADAGCPVHGEPFESDDDFIESVAPFLPSAALLTDAEVAEIKARFLAAQREPVRILPSSPVVIEPADVDAQVAEWKHILERDERTATDTDVRAIQPPAEDVLPAWVIDALNGHNSVDALVESIVARTVTG